MRLRLNRKSSVALVANYWWSAIVATVAMVLVSFLLMYKLGTLTPGFSSPELVQRSESALMVSERNPLFFVQNGLQHIAQSLKHYGPVAMRTPGILIAGIVTLCFYCVLARWYTKRVALLGVLVLVTSSWFLHTARLATHDVMFFTLFAFFAVCLWLQRVPANRLAILTCFIVGSVLLYIPGMIWFIFPFIIWQRRRVRNSIATLARWQLVVFILLSFLVLGPLVIGFFHNPQLVTTWLGLPKEWPPLKEIAKNMLQIPAQLVWQGPDDPMRWLGRLPLLDWFQSAMLLVGAYAYRFMFHLDRTWFLLYVFVFGSILIGLRGPVSLALLLPFVYLVISGGIAFMLQQWFTVFPRNPFARGVGSFILSLALLTSCLYQLNHYFIAWPGAPETKTVFQHRP